VVIAFFIFLWNAVFFMQAVGYKQLQNAVAQCSCSIQLQYAVAVCSCGLLHVAVVPHPITTD